MNRILLPVRLSFLLLIILSACDTTDPKPAEEKPPGYQEDIYWPSLADSPWPIEHGNAQATGRGLSNVGNVGTIDWEFNFSNLGEDLVSGLVVGQDSLIYFVTEMNFSAGLYCIDHSAELKLKVDLGSAHRYTTPTITSNNTILVIDYNTLKAFNDQGIEIWEHTFENTTFWIESIQLDAHGNVYVLDLLKFLHKISPDGELMSSTYNGEFRDLSGTFGMAFSPDGNILYIPGSSKTLLAYSLDNNEILWAYGNESMMTSPLVDSYGNIYCQLNDNIISLNHEGQPRWKFNYDNFIVNDNKPTLDVMGNIYFTSKDTLYSLDYAGVLRWSKKLPYKMVDSPLICDYEGNVYIGFFNGQLLLLKYSNTGDILWDINFDTGGELMQLYSSPVISFNSTLLFPTEKSVFAIK
jgi:outer membrane protein assembly factor BamB